MKFIRPTNNASLPICLDNDFSGSDLQESSDAECLVARPIGKIPKITKIKVYKPTIRSVEVEQSKEDSRLICGNKEINNEKAISVSNRVRGISRQSKTVKLENKERINDSVCSICINDITGKKDEELGRLKCKHVFCIECITQSSDFSNKCPYCRTKYTEIINGQAIVLVDEKQLSEDDEHVEEEPCYVCGRNDDFDLLLVCDYCDSACCHTYCDPRLENGQLPEGNWYCQSCENSMN